MLGRKKVQAAAKVLDVDASLQGNLIFKDPVNLQINGSFEGKLETKGELTIGANAVVRADIAGDKITVSGQVTGDILASVELSLTSRAKVIGNITTPSLSVEKGSVLEGNCSMLGEKDAESSFEKAFLNADEVARYLSVERDLIAEWAASGKLPGSKRGQVWQFEKEAVDEWVANGRMV